MWFDVYLNIHEIDKQKKYMRKQLLLTLLAFLALSQVFAQSIKGRVEDNKKEPVIGATVLIDGTKQGAITDALGSFEIKSVITKFCPHTWGPAWLPIERSMTRPQVRVTRATGILALRITNCLCHGHGQDQMGLMRYVSKDASFPLRPPYPAPAPPP